MTDVKLKRAVLTVLLSTATAGALAVNPLASSAHPGPHAPPAGSHLTVGVADEGPAMFSSSWFRRVPVRIARLVVPWNAAVTHDRTQLDLARSWIDAATADRVSPLIVFGAPAGRAGNYIPSVKQYTAAVKAFMHDLPQVRTYAPWNEPDFIYRSLSRNPALAAAYFNAMVGLCHHCTIVAGEVFMPASDLGSWLAAYKRALRFRPVAWSIHPYRDVRSHTAAQISVLERYAGSAQIWLDEVSGVERRGHWPWPNQSPNGANRDERFLFTLPKRFHNITRIYHYQWQASAGGSWDSGLLGPQGQPRPAYWTFANAVRGKLP